MRRHGRFGRVRCALVIALLVLGAGAWGQSGEAGAAAESEGDDLDAMFDEAVIEDDSGDGDGDGGLGSEDLDALFEEAVVEDDSGDGDGDGAGAADRDGDLDALFDADVMGTADTGGDPIGAAAPAAGLLTRAGVDWGGSFRYDGTVELSFKDYAALSAAVAGDEAAKRTLRHDLAAVLYLDARPNRDFRVFAKGKAKADFASAGRDEADEADEAPEFAFTLFELFADFHWDDRVFFRAGKQRADWGVGRFFSPADLISLVTIDPLDPGAEREGPVAVKVHAPIGVHNGYLYVITDDYTDPLDVAVGARGEVVVGGVELGFGGLMQADLVPKAIATATGALGDFDLFGELVLQRGTERNLIELDARAVKVTARSERDQNWFPAATAGASYLNSNLNVVLAAQYYYNPLGYADSAALGPAFLCLGGGAGGSGQSASGPAGGAGAGAGRDASGPPDGDQGSNRPPQVARCPEPSSPMPEVVDLLFFGRHYAGASVSWNNIADTDLSASLFWLGNLSDGSGLVRPSLSYQVLDHLRVTLGASLGYAATPAAAEYRDNVAFTLAVSLGAGSF